MILFKRLYIIILIKRDIVSTFINFMTNCIHKINNYLITKFRIISFTINTINTS
nr:MAG TPA: hypothetical protein [Crassvirales sp.]